MNLQLFKNMRTQWMLYLMALPGIVYFLIFKYIPMGGSIIAFQDYQIFRGIWDSPWVGLRHFRFMFEFPEFLTVLRNTLVIAFYQLLFAFPAPILLALLLNEVRKMAVKRTIQTLVYLPHFLSWVIVGAIVFELLSLRGLVNTVLALFGQDPVLFMQKESYFRTILITSGIWKDMGFGAIIYLAALAGINPQLYEAAEIDGANRWRQTLSITLPGIMPTVVILFLLNIGGFLELGFDQVFVLLTPMTASVGEIIDTYVYSAGVLRGQYSFTTAVGLFKSVVGLILIVAGNKLAQKTTGQGLF